MAGLLTITLAFAGLTLAPSNLAPHEDDPKQKDLQPMHRGPGFRSSGPGRAGLGVTKGTGGSMFPSQGVTLLSWLPVYEFGALQSAGNDCWGYTSPSGREYAIMGLSGGTGFVEITDPGDPTILEVIPGAGSAWRDIKTYQNYAYSVTEGLGGIQVIDLAQIDSGIVTLVNTISDGTTDKSHNVAIDEASGFLYRCGGDDHGLRIYDLANPAVPTPVASWNTRYVHDAHVVTYTSGPYAGRQIAFANGGFNGGFSQTGLDILDVTDKQNIFVRDRVFYAAPGYSHQSWLSEDQKFLFLNDEMKTRSHVIDVQDLDNAFEVSSFTSQAGSLTHNLYVKGDRLYQANYRSGLRVFDISIPQAPSQVAYFDTWPDDNGAAFNGMWSVYPYFQSGVVLGSAIEHGMFVLWVGPPQLDLSTSLGVNGIHDPAGDTLMTSITELAPGNLATGTVEVHYDIGSGMQTATMTDLGSGQFGFDLPTMSCGDSMEYYVTAKSTQGITWRTPETGTCLSTSAETLTSVWEDDFETDQGWVREWLDDDAKKGRWIRVDPVGSAAQAEDDHSPLPGTTCWVTGQGPPGGANGQADVDGGQTSLVSPKLDLVPIGEPLISYWRWFSNDAGQNPNEDVFKVEISNNDGASWILVDTVGPTGPGTSGGWFHHQFLVSDFITPNHQVRIRFVADDANNPSIVEAGIDDFRILDLACPTTLATTYCTAKQNSLGCTPSISAQGDASASSPTPFTIRAEQVLNQKNGILFYGFGQNALPFQGGYLCIAPQVKRTAVQDSAGNPPPSDCSGLFQYDFNALIQTQSDPNLTSGTQVNAQWWYRDPQDPTGFSTGLSDALEFTIAP